MIIAVNISKALAAGFEPGLATRRSWKIKKKVNPGDFIIGVSNGMIYGYYKIDCVYPDHRDKPRIAFDLLPCSDAEKAHINLIVGNRIKWFVVKYF